MPSRIDDGVKRGLDPVLQQAAEMERRPILPARAWADSTAAELATLLERIALRGADEPDRDSAAQLLHLSEALGACAISLCAFARGLVPRLASKPDASIILDS